MTNSRLGLALEKQQRLDEAIAAHQRAVELDPGWVYSGLIRALTRAERLDQAVAEHDERLGAIRRTSALTISSPKRISNSVAGKRLHTIFPACLS